MCSERGNGPLLHHHVHRAAQNGGVGRNDERDTAALFARLEAADPAAASRIEPANRRRIVRALEVTIGSGRPFSSFGPGMRTYPPTTFSLAGVWLPREVTAGEPARHSGLVASENQRFNSFMDPSR